MIAAVRSFFRPVIQFFTRKAVEETAEAGVRAAVAEGIDAAAAQGSKVFVKQMVINQGEAAAKRGLGTVTKIGAGAAVTAVGVNYARERLGASPEDNNPLDNFKNALPGPLRDLPFGLGSLLGAGILAAIGAYAGGAPIAILLGIVGALGGQSLLNAAPSLSSAASAAASPSPMTAPSQDTTSETKKADEPEVVVPTQIPAKPVEKSTAPKQR